MLPRFLAPGICSSCDFIGIGGEYDIYECPVITGFIAIDKNGKSKVMGCNDYYGRKTPSSKPLWSELIPYIEMIKDDADPSISPNAVKD